MTSLFETESDKPNSGAVISSCGLYRYHLWRVWDDCLPTMVFVMQNPSTADANEDDPTIRRCINFARREQCGGISVRNVFAYRATDETELFKTRDPVGPENEEWLLSCNDVSIMTLLVLAWGTRLKKLNSHYEFALSCLMQQKPKCLGVTKEGHPRHPLYLRNDAPLIEYRKGVGK